MIVDIAPHQQFTEIFTSQPTSMTNGHRFASDDLSKRAELILGPAAPDLTRQMSFDYSTRYPPMRLNISSPSFHSQEKFPKKKDEKATLIDQLLSSIFEVMKIDRLNKCPDRMVRPPKNPEHFIEHRDESDRLTDHEEDEEEIEEEVEVKVNGDDQGPLIPKKENSSAPVVLRRESHDDGVSMASDPENEEEEERNRLNAQNLSLMDFLRPTDSPVKSPSMRERVQVPLKKGDIIKAFSSSVNIPIDLKQPTLTISIPKSLFLQTSPRGEKRTLDRSMNEEFSVKKTKTSSIDHPSAREIFSQRLKSSTNKQLDSLARELKKKADHSRANYQEIRQSMSCYLESACYFIKCATDEHGIDKRSDLLSAILRMLQQLAQNHQHMFQLNTSDPSVDLLSNLRLKFLLINYWLQSYVYQLKFQNRWTSVEGCANEVTKYLGQIQSPLTNPSSDNKTPLLIEFSKHMLSLYHSSYYWNKAERLMSDPSLKDFLEQLRRQYPNRRLSRDEPIVEFILYIFDAIELFRWTSER